MAIYFTDLHNMATYLEDIFDIPAYESKEDLYQYYRKLFSNQDILPLEKMLQKPWSIYNQLTLTNNRNEEFELNLTAGFYATKFDEEGEPYKFEYLYALL